MDLTNPSKDAQPTSQDKRITDLREFAALEITQEKAEVFGYVQSIYERQDRLKSARIVLWVAVSLVIVGTIALVLSIIASIMSWVAWSFISTTIIAVMDGFFFYGYKQLVQHFYPAPLPVKSPKAVKTEKP